MWAWLLPLIVRWYEAITGVRRRVAAQGLTEYAVIICFVAIVVVGILTTLGRTLCTGWYQKLVGPGTPFYDAAAKCT